MWLAALISILGPIVIFAICVQISRDYRDPDYAISGVVHSVALASLISIILRLLVGGFAPDFYKTCDVHLDAILNTDQMYGYVIQPATTVCYGKNSWALRESMTSFPCGPVTAIFAGFGFLFLWLSAKLKIWADHRASPFMGLILLVLAVIFAIILTAMAYSDNKCQATDTVAGAVLGFVTACGVYRLYYASIWDWTNNHMPMPGYAPCKSIKPCPEASKYGPVLSRRAGWGGKGLLSSKDEGRV